MNTSDAVDKRRRSKRDFSISGLLNPMNSPSVAHHTAAWIGCQCTSLGFQCRTSQSSMLPRWRQGLVSDCCVHPIARRLHWGHSMCRTKSVKIQPCPLWLEYLKETHELRYWPFS